MKRFPRVVWLTALFALCVQGPAVAQNPTVLYQGMLTDVDGDPIDAAPPMTFHLYDVAQGGLALWTEQHVAVEVIDGHFAVDLGSVVEIPDAVRDHNRLFLGVEVDGGAEMVPRMGVGGSIRALFSEVAAHAVDVDGEDIHPGTVSIGNDLVINGDGEWVGDPTGLVGPAGPVGPVGAEGPVGPAGPGGAAGPQGVAGPQGAQGQEGEQGVQGPVGPQGAQGVVGPQGAVGAQGPAGVDGAAGPAGADFDVNEDSDLDGFADWIEIMVGHDPIDGADVPADLNGDGIADDVVGPAGEQGLQGAAGADGVSVVNAVLVGDQLELVFSNGVVVNVGEVVGAQGPVGAQGVQGPIGPQGDQGPVGPQGAQGPAGVQGPQGQQGIQGVQGPAGVQGAPGVQGPVGPQGAQGPQGIQGVQGVDGPVGAVGPVGPPGVGLQAAAVNGDGDLEIDLTDGQQLNAGRVVGPQGPGCGVQPVVRNGAVVDGAIALVCEGQDPIELVAYQCGNGRMDPGETCDDGNFLPGDGCSPRCLNECGNGQVDPNEECDDGNMFDNDACTHRCRDNVCGDGFVHVGVEECDDGALNADVRGASCQTNCQKSLCGNARIDLDEECDDGNAVNTDNCTNSCTVAVCGDHIVGPEEQCDGGPGCFDDCTFAECALSNTCPWIEWVRLPAGAFNMGSEANAFELPRHQVQVAEFDMMRTEVTVAQFMPCVTAGACSPPNNGNDINWDAPERGPYPVGSISWTNASQFAVWAGARLPTEAEWEYAARSAGQDINYPWGRGSPDCRYADFAHRGQECNGVGPSPVCSHAPGNSDQGICDLAGNHYEWVQDEWHDTYEGAPVDGSAWCAEAHCPENGAERVRRGGRFNTGASFIRASYRRPSRAESLAYYQGFRLARAIPDE